jgi:hypothetical protein
MRAEEALGDTLVEEMSNPLPSSRIEILFFDGCPNLGAAEELVGRVTEALGIESHLDRVVVESPDGAERARFLGSPSIRVNGRDIEPGADQRTEFSYACRVYLTSSGVATVPEEAWLRQALVSASEVSETIAAGGRYAGR